MSGLTSTPVGTSAGQLPTPVPPTQKVSSTYLAPTDPFPTTLAELELVNLHVLHSRITRQLEREYITPTGPHPVTQDRAQELVAELDTRQEFLAFTDPAPPPEHRITSSRAPRGTGTASRPTAAPPPVPATVDRAGTTRTDPAPRQAEPPVEDLSRLRPGHQVEVWHRGQLQYVGTVEEVAPSLGMMWIREALDGYRRLIHTQDDTELRSPWPRAHGQGHR